MPLNRRNQIVPIIYYKQGLFFNIFHFTSVVLLFSSIPIYIRKIRYYYFYDPFWKRRLCGYNIFVAMIALNSVHYWFL